jgi:DNA-binding response OmpR family regulator
MAASVLLVEDEENLASLVRAYLEQEGYTVLWAGTGAEALKTLETEPVRLVVLDLTLPDIDGLEVCRRIRKRSQVPVVMLTARDEEPDRLAGLDAGADDYIG